MKKNKQFIVKLCHKYIHNINEDILQIYIILQYIYPLRRESIRQQTVLLLKKNTNKIKKSVVLHIHKEHSLVDTRCIYALMHKIETVGFLLLNGGDKCPD